MFNTLLPRDAAGALEIDIDGMIREYGNLVDGKYKLNEQQFEEVCASLVIVAHARS